MSWLHRWGAPRDRTVDTGVVAVAAALGVLVLSITLDDLGIGMTAAQVIVDATFGALCCVSLWWRRRWPFAVALLCVLLGAFSTSGTAAGLFALFSLAVYRPVRPALVVAVLFLPSAVICSIWLGRTSTWSVLLPTMALTAAAIAWGMFVRARRQLLANLRDRAQRAEADQLAHAERAQAAERTRIAREMHDVLAHRISLVALRAGALEVARDLPADEVRESAQLLRLTAHQALEELRDVIGVLREEPAPGRAPTVPQPTLADIERLVAETRRSGLAIDFEMQVDDASLAPGPLGRDAYRIVQEALTNISKHAGGTHAQVRISGAPNRGLCVRVSNPATVRAGDGASPPGSGTGLLGLQERVALANGVLVHGPDAHGDFVVEADLPW